MKFTHLLRTFFGLLYPKLCEACGTMLNAHEEVLCLSCLYHLPRTYYWQIADNAAEKTFWGRAPIEHACSLFFFRRGSRYRKLIHKLKYKGKPEIGVMLGRQLGRVLKDAPFYRAINAIVPVPLHPKKQLKRGYNQSEQIATGIAQATGWEVITSAIIRSQFTDTQTQKARMARWDNVSDVFRLQDAEALNNKHILLVDDVLTTGATTDACIQQLLKAEGCKVSVATLAFVSRT